MEYIKILKNAKKVNLAVRIFFLHNSIIVMDPDFLINVLDPDVVEFIVYKWTLKIEKLINIKH